MNTDSPPAGAAPRTPSLAADAEIDLVFALDPFRDAMRAFAIGLDAFEQAALAMAGQAADLRAAFLLVRATAAVVAERASTLEGAARAVLKLPTGTS